MDSTEAVPVRLLAPGLEAFPAEAWLAFAVLVALPLALTSAAVGIGRRIPLLLRWTDPRGERQAAVAAILAAPAPCGVRAALPRLAAATCASCGAPPARASLLPLAGWLVPCRACGSLDLLRAGVEWLALAALVALLILAPAPAPALPVVLLIVLGAACIACDARALVLPACLCMPLLWAGLLATPFAVPPDRILGTVGLSLVSLALWLHAHHQAVARHAADGGAAQADPLDAAVGEGDVLLSSALGAWLGLLPGLLLLLGATLLLAAWALIRHSTSAPLAPFAVPLAWALAAAHALEVPAIVAVFDASATFALAVLDPP